MSSFRRLPLSYAAVLTLLFALTVIGNASRSCAQDRVPAFAPFRSYGIDAHVGVNGIGGDIATTLAPKFNLRIGGDFYNYSTSFTDEGANVNASLHLASGHASLDWYPFLNGFRVSPTVVFANNNRGRGTAIIPAGSTVTLDGDDYVSSTADPLHGSGSVDFRKTAPGLTVGWGNIIPRSPGRWSFPVELGFYYVGQPRLNIMFTGSACDPTEPQPLGCESVNSDPDFQKSLAAFKSRNENNLSYASFFPIASFGVGYRF
jgi:hypothetical protein